MAQLQRLHAKHLEFEAAAALVNDGTRSIAKSRRGIMQHMVTGNNSILLWPTSYQGQTPKKKPTVRYMSITSALETQLRRDTVADAHGVGR